MESEGVASQSNGVDFDHAAWVIRLSILGDIVGLLHEVVVGPSDDAVVARKHGGGIEAESRDSEIFIHVGDVIQILVPHLAGGSPRFSRRLENLEHGIGLQIAASFARNDNFSTAIGVHIGH